jgi:penicillin-binding protein 2
VVTDQVGLSGIEYAYEDELRGYKGKRNVEVDVAGRELARLAEVLPRPGHNLYLTLDVQFQKAVEEVLRKGMRNAHAKQGVVVALNPQNGEVLAMVSLPAYDDNLFATPIKPEDYEALTEDPLRPLVNHAIIGQYPPGSTFKLVPASGALQEGILNDKTIVKTPGVIWLPNKYFPDDPQLAQPFYDWYKPGFGQLTIREGIAQSSDVFFYKVSGGFPDDFPNGLGLDLFDKYARAFGFGEPTGMDLPGEASGLTPDAAWKRKTFGESWSTGDTYNMGIGQGFVLATPLQLANMAAIVANGGKFYRPHLARAIVDADGKVVRKIEPQLVRSVGVDPQYLQVVREGMRGAVTHGTAWKANLAEVEVAGKTGTAEYFGPRVNGYLPTHAWFIAFAPYENPEIALVVFVAGGGEGSEVAVPIAVDVLRAYFHLPADSPLAGYTAPPPPPESRNAGASVTPRKYAGALIGVEDWNNELPGIFGVVVDKNGRGVPGVRLSVDKGDGNPVTTLTTDTNGAFRYDELDFHVSSRWYARIISPGDSEPVEINVLPYKRYNLQFTATQ